MHLKEEEFLEATESLHKKKKLPSKVKKHILECPSCLYTLWDIYESSTALQEEIREKKEKKKLSLLFKGLTYLLEGSLFPIFLKEAPIYRSTPSKELLQEAFFLFPIDPKTFLEIHIQEEGINALLKAPSKLEGFSIEKRTSSYQEFYSLSPNKKIRIPIEDLEESSFYLHTPSKKSYFLWKGKSKKI